MKEKDSINKINIDLDNTKEKAVSRKSFNAVMAIAMTAVLIVGIVLVNAAVGIVNANYPIRLDMTDKQSYTLTKENVEIIKGIDQDVTVTVLTTKESFLGSAYLSPSYIIDDTNGGYGGGWTAQGNALLENYTTVNSRIELHYVDSQSPSFQPYKAKYPNDTISPGDVLVECGDRHKVLTLYDMLEVSSAPSQSTGAYVVLGSKLESALTSAIINMTAQKPYYVTVLGGHGTADISSFTMALNKNNYEINKVDSLVVSAIPPETDYLIIAAPTHDFSESELKAIDVFLKNDGEYGKHLLYIAGSNQPFLPNVDDFLKEWGIKVLPGIVYETDINRIIPGMNTFTFAEFDGSEYTQQAQDNGLICLTYNNMAVQMVFEKQGYIEVTPILSFPESTVLCPTDVTGDDDTWQATAEQGPFKGAVISRDVTPNPEGDEEIVSTVAVFGSLEFFGEAFGEPLFLNPEAANASVVFNMMDIELKRENEGIFFIIKPLTGDSYIINQTQADWLSTYLFITIIPLLLIIAGIVVWARRRSL